MAARRKNARRAKAPNADPQPVRPPDPSEESPVAPAEAAVVARDPERRAPPVAGIGASAGGLDAFKKLLAALPPDSGIAFVLVPHLDPARESLLVELLARHTAMPVVEVQDDMPVEANRVYVIPPNNYMTIHGGVLRLTGPVERHAAQKSIDLFLRSLAEDQQERSICIILSGTGSHGTQGLKAVKAAGGMAMVQDPATAEYNNMPQSAIATGLADFVLPVEQMPEALIKYVQHGHVNGGPRIDVTPEADDQLALVLALLRARTNFDFRCYRWKMLARCIGRRMRLNGVAGLTDYLTFAGDHPVELKLLVKELFVGVNNFFREPKAFLQLAGRVIAPLLQGKQPGAVIRVWVPGCATGEEAYSLAMLLLEGLEAAHESSRLQIFGTDVDEDALGVARKGLYPEGITADVSSDRLARFFTKADEHTYQVNKQLRDAVTIAVHNLLSDPPFTKLDLVSCRNFLVYLEPDVQKKVVALFHFALNEGGFLFLGPSETIGRHSDLFEPVSKKWRIYRRIGPTRPGRVAFPIVATTEVRGRGRRPAEAAAVPPISFAEVARRALLDQFAPAAVLVNRKYEIFYYSGLCGHYLEFPAGEARHDLMLMAREGLRTRLRAAVHRAARQNNSVVLTDVQVRRDGSYRPVRVTVRPVHAPQAAEGLLLITFEEQPPSPQPSFPPGTRELAGAGDASTLHQLEKELQATREDLQSTVAEMEHSHEELKASNEQVVSMNEELHSANEELKTSQEELQSLNEELSAVNNQLQDKVEDLEKVNNDMANLLNCTDMATVFLDAALRIRLFTPAATKLFTLLASDVGRPVGHVSPRFSDPELLGDAQQVLHQLTPREKEVSTADGRWWVRRILPYRTRHNRIDGVGITFVDITERRRTEQALRDREERLRAILDTAMDAIITIDRRGIIQSVNAATERIFGYAATEMIGQNVSLLMASPYREAHGGYLARYRETGQKHIIGISREVEARRKDGSVFSTELAVSEIEHLGLFTGIHRDLTERKQLERDVVQAASLEQRRIGQDLHDSVAQELTALNLLARDLAETLRTGPARTAQLVEQMTQGLQRSQRELRAVLRGLLPVAVDTAGLMAALSDLADRTRQERKVSCMFDCPEPVSVADNLAATQLYLIAQEAVHNAVKHAQAQHVRITLGQADASLVLRVQDDGIGMPAPPAEMQGLGLRIMRNRAAILGARLTIEPAEPTGTVVTCALVRRTNE
jgi:two-component system CheB/CheR fusion protein